MNDFMGELQKIKSEQDFRGFIQKHNGNPIVQRMLQMTNGKDSDAIMGIANNLAGSQHIELGKVRQLLGI